MAARPSEVEQPALAVERPLRAQEEARVVAAQVGGQLPGGQSARLVVGIHLGAGSGACTAGEGARLGDAQVLRHAVGAVDDFQAVGRADEGPLVLLLVVRVAAGQRRTVGAVVGEVVVAGVYLEVAVVRVGSSFGAVALDGVVVEFAVRRRRLDADGQSGCRLGAPLGVELVAHVDVAAGVDAAVVDGAVDGIRLGLGVGQGVVELMVAGVDALQIVGHEGRRPLAAVLMVGFERVFHHAVDGADDVHGHLGQLGDRQLAACLAVGAVHHPAVLVHVVVGAVALVCAVEEDGVRVVLVLFVVDDAVAVDRVVADVIVAIGRQEVQAPLAALGARVAVARVLGGVALRAAVEEAHVVRVGVLAELPGVGVVDEGQRGGVEVVAAQTALVLVVHPPPLGGSGQAVGRDVVVGVHVDAVGAVDVPRRIVLEGRVDGIGDVDIGVADGRVARFARGGVGGVLQRLVVVVLRGEGALVLARQHVAHLVFDGDAVEDVVARQVDDVERDGAGREDRRLHVGLVALGLGGGRCLERGEVADHAAVVEARHEAHVAVAVVDDHERGVGDLQRRVVEPRGGVLRRRRAGERHPGADVRVGSLLHAAAAVGVGGHYPVVAGALHAHVVGVEALLGGVVRDGVARIAHLGVDVRVGLDEPLRGVVAPLVGGGVQYAAVGLGVVGTLAHPERGRGDAGGGVVGAVEVLAHVVGDVEVGHGAVLHLQRVVGQRGEHLVGADAGRLGEGLGLRVVDVVLVVARRLVVYVARAIEAVLADHGAVVFAQLVAHVVVAVVGRLHDGLAHDFPAVLVEQHEHTVDVGLHQLEGAVAQLDGLEPVLLLQVFLAGFAVFAPLIPRAGVDPGVVAVPAAGLEQGLLRRGELERAAVGGVLLAGYLREAGRCEEVLRRRVVAPVLFERGDVAALVRFALIVGVAIAVQVYFHFLHGAQLAVAAVVARAVDHHVLGGENLVALAVDGLRGVGDVVGDDAHALLIVGAQVGVARRLGGAVGVAVLPRGDVDVVGVVRGADQKPRPARARGGAVVDLLPVEVVVVDVERAVAVGVGVDVAARGRLGVGRHVVGVLRIVGGAGLELEQVARAELRGVAHLRVVGGRAVDARVHEVVEAAEACRVEVDGGRRAAHGGGNGVAHIDRLRAVVRVPVDEVIGGAVLGVVLLGVVVVAAHEGAAVVVAERVAAAAGEAVGRVDAADGHAGLGVQLGARLVDEHELGNVLCGRDGGCHGHDGQRVALAALGDFVGGELREAVDDGAGAEVVGSRLLRAEAEGDGDDLGFIVLAGVVCADAYGEGSADGIPAAVDILLLDDEVADEVGARGQRRGRGGERGRGVDGGFTLGVERRGVYGQGDLGQLGAGHPRHVGVATGRGGAHDGRIADIEVGRLAADGALRAEEEEGGVVLHAGDYLPRGEDACGFLVVEGHAVAVGGGGADAHEGARPGGAVQDAQAIGRADEGPLGALGGVGGQVVGDGGARRAVQVADGALGGGRQNVVVVVGVSAEEIPLGAVGAGGLDAGDIGSGGDGRAPVVVVEGVAHVDGLVLGDGGVGDGAADGTGAGLVVAEAVAAGVDALQVVGRVVVGVGGAVGPRGAALVVARDGGLDGAGGVDHADVYLRQLLDGEGGRVGAVGLVELPAVVVVAGIALVRRVVEHGVVSVLVVVEHGVGEDVGGLGIGRHVVHPPVVGRLLILGDVALGADVVELQVVGVGIEAPGVGAVEEGHGRRADAHACRVVVLVLRIVGPPAVAGAGVGGVEVGVQIVAVRVADGPRLAVVVGHAVGDPHVAALRQCLEVRGIARRVVGGVSLRFVVVVAVDQRALVGARQGQADVGRLDLVLEDLLVVGADEAVGDVPVAHEAGGLSVAVVVGGLVGSGRGEHGELLDDVAVVEARHEAHVAVGVLDGHEGGVGDVGLLVVVGRGTQVAEGGDFGQVQARAVAGPGPGAQFGVRGVGGEAVDGVVDMAVNGDNLQVVGVEAVAAGVVVVEFGVGLALGFAFGTGLAGVEVAHLAVDVEVGLDIPVATSTVCGDVAAGVAQIAAALAHLDGRGLDGISGGGADVAVGVGVLDVVGDVEVGDVAVLIADDGVVGQRRAVFGQVADGVLVVAGSLAAGGPEVVLLHHRAVILAQGGLHLGLVVGTAGGQRLAHDFPAVVV